VTGTPARTDEDISGACNLGQCGHCHGNVDLKSGPGPAVALLRCRHNCHRGQTLKVRYT